MARNHVYVEHLRGVALFSGLTKKELERVAMAGSEVELHAGNVVMQEGQPGRTALVILKGTLVARRNGRKVRDLGPGEIVGELALIDDQPRSATVETVTDALVLEITGGQFRLVLDEVPSIRIKLLAALASRVRELDRARL
ncbi:MAG TPA: cyclic nucleotide-binding domain-containing protein [Ilumatobacteraceae bacterium]|nr:cyclic nucleotide-binding domain-containing protein [Ilumatobacteraceae bacterium]